MGAEHLLNEYEMVVIVAFIIAAAAIIITAISSRRGKPNDAATDLVADNRRLGSEVTTLKERVAVLERIATDKNHRLEHEFERLRGS